MVSLGSLAENEGCGRKLGDWGKDGGGGPSGQPEGGREEPLSVEEAELQKAIALSLREGGGPPDCFHCLENFGQSGLGKPRKCMWKISLVEPPGLASTAWLFQGIASPKPLR